MQTNRMENYLYAMAHCPFLSHKEKWKILITDHPKYSEFTLMQEQTTCHVHQKKIAFWKYLKAFDLDRIKKEHEKAKVNAFCLGDEGYPYALGKSYEPPMVLFYKGDISLLYKGTLGIVGARECTPYGHRFLSEHIPAIIDQGLVTVSGLAKGIDTQVHKQTIENGGKTIAVIGNGINYTYPRENRKLQEIISQDHLILSEYPLDATPKRHYFPLRNRIISGLSRGVLVVEAKERSGSLITARLALEEGRDVFSVPGSIFSSTSKGCLDLIKSGAILCQSAEDILTEWNMNL
ncbi:DNA-processing protein DprA [Alkalibacterium kapii]|uniref:DNA processing protein DprA n=1 Tax=Alkalibacterium kapii TaxID=426704 RepID=A0A511B199_9LACT|nr:DNA-processing protein DprA [Alkalibacterium kapii]GEK91597.1 DNA processing protein DprA [Alkalibacterium kapii]